MKVCLLEDTQIIIPLSCLLPVSLIDVIRTFKCKYIWRRHFFKETRGSQWRMKYCISCKILKLSFMFYFWIYIYIFGLFVRWVIFFFPMKYFAYFISSTYLSLLIFFSCSYQAVSKAHARSFQSSKNLFEFFCSSSVASSFLCFINHVSYCILFVIQESLSISQKWLQSALIWPTFRILLYSCSFFSILKIIVSSSQAVCR